MLLKRPFQILLLAGLLCGSGCGGPPEPPSTARTVTDDLGRSVVLPATVARVVTLAPNLTEIVYAAGSGARLVGVSTADDFPPAVDTLPRFSALPLDFEAIVALRPDLVLATDHVNSTSDAETFAALGLPVYFFSFNTVGGLLQSLRTTGTLLGTPTAAAHAADSLQAALDALQQATAGLPERPLTLLLVGDETLYAFGDESYTHGLITLAGGRSATENIGMDMPVLSDEFVLTQQPDVIIGTFGDAYDPAQLLALHPTWDVVPAVAHGRVYSIESSLLLRPGPRLIAGAYRMAALLHPTLRAASPAPTP